MSQPLPSPPLKPTPPPRPARPSRLTLWIFSGLLAGIFLGLFLGELALPLKEIGDAYIGLMQMTVLPYIVFSLVGNIGRLSLRELRVLTGTGLLIFLLLWCLASLTVLLVTQAFPELETSRFFSASMVDPPPRLDWLNLFIPANPFHSLADNAVPAVVIFCILLGIGLAGFPDKSSLLDHLGLMAKTLHRVNGMVVRLTPLGVFAIAASAAGAMTLEEFERLQGYYLAFGASVLLLTLGVLPMLVSSCTPFRYREVVGASRNALLTAFVTGSVLAVIPLLIEGANALFARLPRQSGDHADFPEFILPLAYPFPNSGNVVALLFIPFAAWFMGDPLNLGGQLGLFGLGLFLMFGKVFLAIPFLLNFYQLPQDMFQLFLAAGILAGRLGDVLSSMHYLVFTLLVTAAMTGGVRFRWRVIVRQLALLSVVLLLTMAGIHGTLLRLDNPEAARNQVLSRTSLLDREPRQRTLLPPGPNPAPLATGQNRLQRIRERGIIRVGVFPDSLPYAYINNSGALVGFDIDLVSQLAKELGVAVEWVPFQRDTLLDQIQQDHFDLAISGITVTLPRASAVLMTEPYLIVNLGLVVRDYRRTEFDSEARIARLQNFRLGVNQGGFFEQSAREHFPNATLVPLNSPREFFEKHAKTLDALAIHAESGAAWTLVYPAYSVVNPLQRRDSAPVAMIVGGFDTVLGATLNTWIALQKMNGATERLFDYWMLGKEDGPRQPRWSIVRDVLHWVS